MINTKLLCVFAVAMSFAALVNADPAGSVLRFGWSNDTMALPTDQASPRAVALDNKLYVAPGATDANQVMVYDSPTNEWSAMDGVFPTSLVGVAVAAVRRHVVFAGATDPNGQIGATYNVDTGVWTANMTALSYERFSISPCTLGTKVYFGFGAHNTQSGADVYDDVTGQWSPVALPPNVIPRGSSTVGNAGPYQCVWAGFNGGAYPRTAVVFDSRTGVWSFNATALSANMGNSAGGSFGATKFFVAAGTAINVYDSVTGAWTVLPQLSTSVNYIAAGTSPDGFHVFITGTDDTIQGYNAITGTTFTLTNKLGIARDSSFIASVGSKLLVLGGYGGGLGKAVDYYESNPCAGIVCGAFMMCNATKGWGYPDYACVVAPPGISSSAMPVPAGSSTAVGPVTAPAGTAGGETAAQTGLSRAASVSPSLSFVFACAVAVAGGALRV